MHIEYNAQGTCSRIIHCDIEDGTVRNVSFIGGCNGNQKGISALVEGQKAVDVIARLKGICCGVRQTSCPDQLARALESALSADT